MGWSVQRKKNRQKIICNHHCQCQSIRQTKVTCGNCHTHPKHVKLTHALTQTLNNTTMQGRVDTQLELKRKYKKKRTNTLTMSEKNVKRPTCKYFLKVNRRNCLQKKRDKNAACFSIANLANTTQFSSDIWWQFLLWMHLQLPRQTWAANTQHTLWHCGIESSK